jgi:ATP adenylyltransferase
MERLWSPWRSEYVTSAGEDESCIFCAALRSDEDEASGVLYRSDEVFVMLNAYPYNSGHVMVATRRHVGELVELSAGERHGLMDAVAATVGVLSEALHPHGFNMGTNLGRVAGAGVPGHLHVHVVPRWGGDTNFMPVVGQTKVLPEMLADTDAKLRPLFARLENRET